MQADRAIYMDHHATTPVDARVLEAMLPYFRERFGNASSRSHRFGLEARDAAELARRQVAELLGASSDEIVFTSGATESDNLAIKGAAHALRERGDHLITVQTEHPAVLDSCARLETEGFRVTRLPVDAEGRLDPSALEAAITGSTILASVMLANNELGTMQDIAAIGAITRREGVLLHCDAAQGIGRVPFDVEAMNVDLASLSGHKMHGPKGVGALYLRRHGARRVRLIAEMDGGGQERGMRSGTLNVPGIVGLGAAASLLTLEGGEEASRVRALRDRLEARLVNALEEIQINGAADPWRLPGSLNVSFRYVDAASLLVRLSKIVAISSGSACASARTKPSYVLRAIGLSAEDAASSIRFGLGRENTAQEVERVAEATIEAVLALRSTSERWRRHREGGEPEDPGW